MAEPDLRDFPLDEGRPGVFRDVGSGTPVVLLHGFLGSGVQWARNWSCWAQNNRVLVPDFPGHGRTGMIPGFDYGVPALAEFVRQLMEQELDQAATIVGNSLGGQVALYLGLHSPEVVRRLVLLAPAGGGPVGRGRGWLWRRLTRWLPIGTLRRPVLRFALRRMMRAGREHEAVDRLIGDLVDLIARTPARRFRLMTIRVVDSILKHELWHQARDLDRPTRIIWGARDPVLPLRHGINLVNRIQPAHLTVLPDTGHLPALERPTRVNSLLQWELV